METTQRQQLQGTMMADPTSDIGVLNQRVISVEEQLRESSRLAESRDKSLREYVSSSNASLSAQITGLVTEFRAGQNQAFAASKTNWLQVFGTGFVGVSSMIALMSVVGYLAYSPIVAHLDRHDQGFEKTNAALKADTEALAASLKSDLQETAKAREALSKKIEEGDKLIRSETVPKEDVISRRQYDDRRFDAMIKVIDKMQDNVIYKGRFEEMERRVDERQRDQVETWRRAMDDLRQQIRDVRADLVTRDENKAHWEEINSALSGLGARINEMQHTYGSTFTVGDQLKNLQGQVDQMRNLLTTSPAPSK